MEIIDHPSPNHTERRGGARATIVVVHYTAMDSAQSAAKRLCDPAAEVSAHYLVDADGTVLRLVAEDRRAWHAGASQWGDVTDVNSQSIGIELANPGHHAGYPPFPEAQMAAMEGLLGAILPRWSIPPERVLGHACIAPGRKIDPGEKFDWRRLALQGLSVWVDPSPGDTGPCTAGAFQRAAARIGYAVPDSGTWCDGTHAVWHAFAMRFLPHLATEPPSIGGMTHACLIAEHWPCRNP